VPETQLVTALEAYAVLHFGVAGLSHVFRPLSWVRFFVLLREHGHAGVFAHGFLSLYFGSMIVAFHNVWTGTGIPLTIVGWLYMVKTISCFVFPDFQLASLRRVSTERAWELQAVGAAYLLLTAWLVVRLTAFDSGFLAWGI
jgi:hypothetical protein